MSGLLLEIVEGPGAGERLALDDAVELGRDPGLPHPLEDVKVSRHHARIRPVGGAAEVEDLGSTNGTFLNDQPLQIPTSIGPGDRIRVGLTVLELRRADDRSPAVAVPDLTQIDDDVLAPVPSRELAQVPEPAEPQLGAVRAAGSEPRYVNTAVGRRIDQQLAPPPPPVRPGSPAPAPAAPEAPTDEDYAAVQRLADDRVKPRTNVAAFALIAIAALVVIIYFGVR
ncbi:MAG: FHA domain-containing protein [Solirubrobacterales bacterium]|nr:FHA domain-containing protein [Solirubrobacterales bacterium]